MCNAQKHNTCCCCCCGVCLRVPPAAATFFCAAALVIDNTGNVPLSIGGLEALQATQADGSPCSSTGLAPTSSITCDFLWTVSPQDSEAATGTIALTVVTHDIGATDSATAAPALNFTGAATLAVPQHPAMTVVLEQVAPIMHSSNGGWAACTHALGEATVLLSQAITC